MNDPNDRKGIVTKPGVSGVGKVESFQGVKCYMCGERDAVGNFLGKPFCKECVQSIKFD